MNTKEREISYHILKGRPTQYRSENNEGQVLLECAGKRFWAIVNVRLAPNILTEKLLYIIDEDYKHPITEKLEKAKLPFGFSHIAKQPKGLALDCIKSNIINLRKMTLLLNDSTTYTPLNEVMASLVKRVQHSDDACMYFFGSRFLDAEGGVKRKNPFRLINNEGIEHVSLNKYVCDKNSQYTSWQDGALLVHFPKNNTWSALFTAHKLEIDQLNKDINFNIEENNGQEVNIVAIDIEKNNLSIKNVYIFNGSNENINLKNWFIEDDNFNTEILNDFLLLPKSIRVIQEIEHLELNMKYGYLTLNDANGQKVGSFSYQTDLIRNNTIIANT